MTKLNGPQWNTTEENSWNRLFEANDSRFIWNAIDWSGKIGLQRRLNIILRISLSTNKEICLDYIDISASPVLDNAKHLQELSDQGKS